MHIHTFVYAFATNVAYFLDNIFFLENIHTYYRLIYLKKKNYIFQ